LVITSLVEPPPSAVVQDAGSSLRNSAAAAASCRMARRGDEDPRGHERTGTVEHAVLGPGIPEHHGHRCQGEGEPGEGQEGQRQRCGGGGQPQVRPVVEAHQRQHARRRDDRTQGDESENRFDLLTPRHRDGTDDNAVGDDNPATHTDDPAPPCLDRQVAHEPPFLN
jgi:hypothetical protein